MSIKSDLFYFYFFIEFNQKLKALSELLNTNKSDNIYRLKNDESHIK